MPSDKAVAPAASLEAVATTAKADDSFRPVASAEQTLRLMVIALLLAPILLAAGGAYLGYLAYETTFAQARAQLSQATAVAAEHAVRVLDTHKLVAARIEDLIAGLSDEQIQAREKQLHDRMAQQIRGLHAVETAWVEDRAGHPLVTATVYPADRSLDLSDQDYFRALQEPATDAFIGAVPSRRTGKPLFTVARRRQDASGAFAGVIVVGVSPDYFRNFYDKLLDNQSDYSAGLFRDDGSPLARYPQIVWRDARSVRSTLLLQGIAGDPQAGIVAGRSSVDARDKLVAYRRIDNYPLYTTVGRTRDSVLAEWWDVLVKSFVFRGPAIIGLVILSAFAWRRTRREKAAVAQAREAMARRQAAEEQLRQAQKMDAIGQLTAGVAHDFNNLLTVVSGNLELLQRRVGDDQPELKKSAAAALRGIERATDLTRRLLAFSRRQPLDPKPIDVNGLVVGALELLRRTLGEQVTIETVLSGNLWTGFVDPNELEHSLLNLAINARDAMPQGGKLLIKTTNVSIDDTAAAASRDMTAGRYVAVSLTDTGSGMTQAVLEKAFEPFFTTKEAGQGTGLGLSQVYGFVRQSGGHCTIASELGEGTTVTLYLPCQPGSAGLEIEAPTPAGAAARRGERILVVEDDADVRGFVVELLGELGYGVLAAPDGAAALDLLDRHPGIRLLFTDCVLPGALNGRELADEACRRHPDLKVLYTTGYPRDAIGRQGRVEPGIELLLKPFTAAALAEKVRQALSVRPEEAAYSGHSFDSPAPGV